MYTHAQEQHAFPFTDTSLALLKKSLAGNPLQAQWKSLSQRQIDPPDSLARKHLHKLRPTLPRLQTPPLLATGGGQVQYAFLYNNRVDSPFAENNIYQHQLQGNIQATIGRAIPLQIFLVARKTNSAYFRNIFEVRAEADFDALKQLALRQWLNELAEKTAAGSASAILAQLEHYKTLLSGSRNWLGKEDIRQQYRDYRAIVNNPSLVTDSLVTDSRLRQQQEVLLQKAGEFIKYYEQADSLWRHYAAKADSLEHILQGYRNTAERYRLFLQRLASNNLNAGELEAFAAQQGISHNLLEQKVRQLFTQNRLSLGRSLAGNASTITQNTRINGIKYERAGRGYFLFVNAGLVDFAVRDYVSHKQQSLPKEYLVMAKAALGRQQGQHLFVLGFAGRKRDFAGARNTNGDIKTLPVGGLGLGGRLQLFNPSSYITWEVSQALKSFPAMPGVTIEKPAFGSRTSKALSATLNIQWPRAGTLLHGWYKYFGAGFQSFAGNRIAGNQNQWGIKASQRFFHERLKLEAAVRTYEFNNHFAANNISAQTIVKSFSLSYRQPKMPAIYLGYLPMQQVVKNGNIFQENAYQVLNATISHQYKIGIRKTVAALTCTRFFNGTGDTAFAFYNATSIYYQQQIFFAMYTGNFGFSYNRNALTEWSGLDGGLSIPFGRRCQFSLGGKVMSINRTQVKTGWNCSGFVRVFRNDYLQAAYQKTIVPVSGSQFTTAAFASLQFTKTFK